MKLLHKQLKQLIKEELSKFLMETMIKPSDLTKRVMNDPNVNPKLKAKLQKALKEDDLESIKQALELIGGLYPEYSEEAFFTDPNTLDPEYEVKYENMQLFRPLTKLLFVNSKESIEKAIALGSSNPRKKSDLIHLVSSRPKKEFDHTIHEFVLNLHPDFMDYIKAKHPEWEVDNFSGMFGKTNQRNDFLAKIHDGKHPYHLITYDVPSKNDIEIGVHTGFRNRKPERNPIKRKKGSTGLWSIADFSE